LEGEKVMGSTTILIVDDDSFVREILVDILESEDFKTDTAENGLDALNKYKENASKIDVIVSDINMPIMGGVDLIKALRNDVKSEVPVVVLSGNNEVAIAIDAINSGASEYILKDENLQETIVLALNKALENKRIVDENRALVHNITQKNEEMGGIIQRMNDLGTALSAEKNFQNLMEIIISNARELTHADAGTLYLIEDEKLSFKIVQNDTLKIHLGGKSSEEIKFPPVEIKESNVSGYSALKKEVVNIPDVYSSELFDFTGPKKFDQTSNYRSKSMLVVPMVNRMNDVVGVLQLLNSKDPDTGEVVTFSESSEEYIKALGSQAAVAVNNLLLEAKAEKLFEEILNIKNYNESILESLTNGVITLDANNQIIKCNAAVLRILETQEDQIVNQSAQKFFAQNNRWVLDNLKRVIQMGSPAIVMDTELIFDNDRVVPLNLTAVPLKNAKSELIGSMLVLEDITSEKRMKGTLARYMDKDVAEQLMEGGEDMLGGQSQEASVLFSDIRSFTTLTEKLGPAGTVAMLNEYFTEMVDYIFKYKGILDKYIGDAILAVFGVPFTNEQDPENAVNAAIGMVKSLTEFNAKRILENKDPIDIGIGVNTDTVLAGNIGSEKRMDYTVIGDGVNLAARLEGATKSYGAKILISESTKNKLTQDHIYREVDKLVVKGKTKPVSVFEVLDFHNESTFPKMKECLEIFNEGYQSYLKRNWDEGVMFFEEVLTLNPNDKPASLYVERLRLYKENPPADDWDGSFVMTTK